MAPDDSDGMKRLDRPRCFMDLVIGINPVGRLVFELYSDKCPITAENFRALCTGEKKGGRGEYLHYKGCTFHEAHSGWCVVGGDITNKNGTGGESIYGPFFGDECHSIKHDEPYLLSMLNYKNGTNNSQFIISLCEAPSMDGQYPVFGRVFSGHKVLDEMTRNADGSGCPKQRILIADCGQLPRTPFLEPLEGR